MDVLICSSICLSI